jgi:AraC-like DNA-binding protein
MNIHGMPQSGDFLLRIFTVAHIYLNTGAWRAQSVYDPFWRFYANERDSFEVFCGEGKTKKAVKLSGEKCYLIPDRTLFSGRSSQTTRHFYIHFDVVGAFPFTTCCETAPIIEAPLGNSALKALLEPLASETQMTESEVTRAAIKPVNILRARALLHEAFAACLERGVIIPAEENRVTLAIRPALDFIERHLHERLTNGVLAERCHFSTDHFIEKFTLAMGTTPAQYLMERRLSVAAQRLLFSNDSIDTIATATGFCDRFHLSRAFKKRFGQTPVAYRKSRLV